MPNLLYTLHTHGHEKQTELLNSFVLVCTSNDEAFFYLLKGRTTTSI